MIAQWGRSRLPLGVKRVAFVMSAVRPVYPKQQTFLDPVGTSHLCKKRTLPLLFRYL
jgi:hypothetical protein